MDTTSTLRQPAHDAPARLLVEIPRLARPLDVVRNEVYHWATKLGFGSVFAPEQFKAVYDRVLEAHKEKAVSAEIKADLDIAYGAVRALELHPPGGWGEYIEQWTVVRLEHRMKIYKRPEFMRLRTLSERVGGVLLGSPLVPLMLVLPQPTGTYIQMGWDTVVELDRSPFGSDRNSAKVLREHVVEGSERGFTVPAL